MMPLGNQVTSLKLSERLKELGVKQYAFWHYAPDENGTFNDLYMSGQTTFDISAFSVAELGEMLPARIEGHRLRIVKSKGGKNHDRAWVVYYGDRFPGDDDKISHPMNAVGEADARAKMLIYLIEKGLVTP